MENTQTVEQQVKELQEAVRKHDRLYEQAQPIITDSEYDALYMELIALEEANPQLKEGSPTQSVIHVPVASLQKVTHMEPMLSQEKITDTAGVLKFISKQTGGKLLIQQKLDGLTVVLTYEDGKLLHAVTRGDGYVGEDVTHTVSTFDNVPKRIEATGRLVVRMEAVLPFAEFERINQDGRYSNPRNLVSGTVRQLDPSIAAERNLQGIVFETIHMENSPYQKDEDQLAYLAQLGFTVVESKTFDIASELDEAVEYVETYGELIRPTLLHMIDGLILKFNDLSIRETLGSASKYPKWACAYKFPSLDARSVLRNVVFQVGKSGQITPVAEFDTTTIASVNISRATLHNFRNIREKDIKLGDTIIIQRANDVIPQVAQSVHAERTGEEVQVVVPDSCPACDAHVVMIGENLFCMGTDCKPQLEGKLVHFVKRDAMNIDGLGEKTVVQLYEAGLIDSVSDIYRLEEKRDEILGIPRFGVKKFEKMIAGIEESKTRAFGFVLYGLSIPLVGRSASRELAEHFDSVVEMVEQYESNPSFEALIRELPLFGEIMTKNLMEFLATDENRDLIRTLHALGLQMKSEEKVEVAASSPFVGKTFVITGTLSKGREEFKAEVEAAGGKVSGSVSKKTDYLLMGDGAEGTSKHKKALEHGVTILDEQAYLASKGDN